MRNLLTILVILLSNLSHSQCVTGTPPTLTCGTPISVASNTPSGVYGSASTGNPSCAIAGDKVTDADLFAITYAAGQVISVDMCLTAANYVSILSTDGCTELACENYGTSFNQDVGTCNGIRKTTISLDDLGLTVGATYYVKVQGVANCGGSPCSSASISGRSYTIECNIMLANSCSNGVVMSGGTTYAITNDNSADNSGDPNGEGLDCGYSVESNLMYYWCTDAVNSPVTVEISNLVVESGTSVQFAVLDDNCGGNFNDIQCQSGFSTDQSILITGTTASTCYWITFDGNAGTTFNADVTLIDADVLPVELIYFKGENKGSYNKLLWATASEINCDYYTIERSVDTYSWDLVGKMNGVGNSSQTVHYYQNDNTIKNEQYYYRLTQYDFDGKSEVFRIIVIDNTDDDLKRNLEKVYTVLGEDITDRYEYYGGVKIYVYDDGYVYKTIVSQ